MPKDQDFFREALIGKKIPILTLDNQWHKLFTQLIGIYLEIIFQ